LIYKNVTLHKSILGEFGHELGGNSRILDFGCGSGEMVQEYRNAGFQAFGTDIVLDVETELLRRIQAGSYRIPFDDGTFDFVFSNSVLEHVQDLSGALNEIRRVLRPGGVSLHVLPSKFRLIEPHVFVPLAGLVRNKQWLRLWASIGVRNSFQKGLSSADVARKNFSYLHAHTFYRSKRQLRSAISVTFSNLMFADAQIIRYGYGRARHLSHVVRFFPVIARAYGMFHSQCLLFEKP